MARYFSIGETAKLNDLSIQALRHYDKIGLLKPSYVKENSKYRFYSVKDFVVLDLIKQCKAMGLPLEEIKGLIDNYTSFESMLDIINNQKNIIDKKLAELNTIRKNITLLEDRIQGTLNEGMNKVFCKYREERKFLVYSSSNRYTDEFEIDLSKVQIEISNKYSGKKTELAFRTSYNDLVKDNFLTYNNILIYLLDKGIKPDGEVLTLPAGEYLVINFDDDYNDTKIYYEELLKYIRAKNIVVNGDFYEIYVLTRVGSDGREKSLGQIEILTTY